MTVLCLCLAAMVAQPSLVILDPMANSVFTKGCKSVLHMHTATEFVLLCCCVCAWNAALLSGCIARDP